MVSLAISFPSGRFHATPWDRHVNEGVAEWPISPWRILRALTAALHTRCPGLDRGLARETLHKLSAPPHFTLPPATSAHTRHYLSSNTLKRTDTSLTIDAFVALARDARVHVHWPIDLSSDERRALAAMARGLSYLGRAESWCEVSILESGVEGPMANCSPMNGSGPAPGTQAVRVLCAAPEVTNEDLERTTAALQREGWSDPPGSRWVLYHRASDALTPGLVLPGPPRDAQQPTVAELAFGGPVLPLLTDAVIVAEQIRAAAMSRHGAPSETLSGKTTAGQRLLAQHRHAHYVPDARGRTGRITHCLVHAPAGFTEAEQAALAGVSFLVQRHNRVPLDVVLSGFGNAPDLARATPLFGDSRRWRSRTPFVLTRHPRRGKDTPADQVIRELRLRGFPQPVEVISLAGAALTDPRAGDAGLTRWVEFLVERRDRPHPPGVVGFGLVFAEPVRGPMLLGYGCHYGLGQFEAVP
jgi:CRISPR-associated protein Csb2